MTGGTSDAVRAGVGAFLRLPAGLPGGLPWLLAVIAAAACILGLGGGYVRGIVDAGLFPFDGMDNLVGRDFLNVWMMGREALSDAPGRFYQTAEYNAYLRSVLTPDYPRHDWSYPPLIFPYAIPFGFFPYLTALVLWMGATYAFFMAMAGARGGPALRVALIGLSPAIFVNLLTGQNGFLVSGLMIGALRWLDTRPRLAGILIGLLAFKPQMGLLFPVALLLSRRWQVFAWAAATAAALAAVSTAIVGLEPWQAYFGEAVAAQVELLREGRGFPQALMATPFMNARLAGLSADAALALQLPFSLLAVAATVWTFSRRRDPLISAAVLVTATFLLSPYQHIYDAPVLAWAAVAVRERSSGTGAAAATAALWVLPVVALALGFNGVPGSALIVAGFLVWALFRLRKAQADERADLRDALRTSRA